MVAQFPLPVLSVAADAVRDLEGRDALSGLWTLFTKCKESLQDGRRLENISWRLWYREMMLSNQERELGSPDNEPEHFPSEKEKEAILDEKSSYQPPTPSESSPMPPPYSEPDSSHSRSASPQLQQGTSPSPSSPTASASHSPSPAPGRSIPHSNRRPSISCSRRSSFLNGNSGTPVCVGKMIYDMLPSSASASASSSSSSSNSDSSKGGMAALFLPGPVISRRTSSASSSSGDSEIKANQSQMASNAPLGLDPKIQMTPIGAGSSSPASSPPAALAVAESALRLMRLPSISPSAIIPPQNGVSCLPTPEMEAEPEAMIIRATNTHTTIASASSSTVPALSSNVNHNQSTLISATAPSFATSLALSHNPNDSAVNSTTIYDRDSRSTALSPPTARALYTGPPSPSLSDSYARAHPGEVEVKEVGLMPSLSSNTNNQMVGLSHQSLLESSTQLPHQTPPAASSTITIPLMQTPPQQHEPPTLVVVNPTPNPTPHPTPPATPLLHGTIGPGGLIRSQWLTLPEGAAGGGARQHQLLQAAQHQMHQMQASHHQVTALRLPPPVGAGVGLGVGAAVQVNAIAHPGAGDIFGPDHVDRSRSVTRGFSEVSYGAAAAASSASTGSRGVVSSDLNYAQPAGLTAPDRQRPPVSDESRQGSLSLERDPADDDPYLRQEQAPYQHQQPRDKVNRHSISSATSSNHSHLSDMSSASGRAESTTTDTTVSSSEAENQHQERNSLQGWSAAERAAMFDAQQALVQKQHGSLSTIQSMSTLVDRKKENGASDAVHSRSTSAEDEEEEEEGSDEVGICVVDGEAAEEDDAPLSPLPPPGGLAMSPRQDKRRKRNSAPALLGLSPAASTGSGSGQPSAFTSSPKSASTTSAVGKRKTVTAGAPMLRRANSVRSSSRSRSKGGSSVGGSSVGKSRSRSREPGVVGLGGLGMTSAAAAPVAAVTARKPTTVAAGRGRAKVVLGRAGFKAKGGVIRRNSSGLGTAATAQAEALEQELQREQVENEHRDQLRAEALEKERQRNLHQAEDRRRVEEQALALVREKAAREERMRVEEEERREEERQRHREQIEALAAGVEAGGSKRPVRFNIGSNSDEGSGLGSKSVGSGSDVSGGLQGDGRGGSRVDELRVPLTAKAKGKERQRDVDPRDMVQQLHQHLQQHQEQQQRQQQQQSETKDQLNLQQHLQRQMSKQQLHQLQKMQQLHQQHQNQTTIHQHQPQQYQQQFQHQQQLLQLGQANQFPPTSRQASSKQLDLGGGREDERVDEQQKGKGKEREVVSVQPPSKPTKSTSKVNVALDNDLAAKVKQSLAAPLLPQNRRTIVLATSESDFETDSEDEGSWSSEEMTGDESVEKRAREEQLRQLEMERQQELLQQQYQQQQVLQQRQRQQQHQQNQVQQQQHQPPVPAPGVQRTQSSHYPAPNNGRGGRQVSRAQQQQNRQAQMNAHAIMEQAALEAQRQREMFVKLPTTSFQNLANARTRSVGLLTQLMNPNPDIFPVNHPYRRGFSSGEIRPTGMAPMRPLTPAAPAVPEHAPAPAAKNTSDQVANDNVARPAYHRRSTDNGSTKRPNVAPGPSRHNFSPPSRAVGMQRTKSAAALPLSSQIMAGSISTKAPAMIDLTTAMLANGVMPGGYRPKGPPEGQELEDSDSEADTGIQVSSVAQERLKALAHRSRILTNAGRNVDVDRAQPRQQQQAGPSHADDDDVPQWARVSQPQPQPQPQHTRSQSTGQPQNRRPPIGLQFTQMANIDPPTHQNPAPIPFGYPYNLPVAPPSSPRTTRRHMLSAELTESLRRNLLWERQISKVNLTGVKRSASGGGSRHSVLGGIQPLTAAPSMVQLHAKGTGPPDTSNDDQEFRQGRGGGPDPDDDKKRKAMARNKSWANNYHYSGW